MRLDSGDLGDHARKVRRILDDGGFPEIRIFASGGLDERIVHDLLAAGAPIDGFGIGTSMVTSEDAPTLSPDFDLAQNRAPPVADDLCPMTIQFDSRNDAARQRAKERAANES